MKGNFTALAMVVIGGFALLVNSGWLQVDYVNLVRKWWPMGLVVLGIILYFTPDGKAGDKAKDQTAEQAEKADDKAG